MEPFIARLIIPAVVLILTIVILAVVTNFAKTNYIKIPPHMVAVISGRKRMVGGAQVGYRLVRGGATLVLPFFERRDELDLRTLTIDNLEVHDAVTKEGVPLTVKAVANLKIGSSDALLMNAVERLMGKSIEDIKKMAFQTLEGHLRSMLGSLTVEQVNNDRQEFSSKMLSESQADLAKLGLQIDVLTVKELADTRGYLESLGKKKIAEIKKDAEIGTAVAQRESVEKSTTAQAEAEKKKQENLVIAAEAEKAKNVSVAKFQAETNAEMAKAAQAGPLATAEAKKAVVQAEQEVELTKTEKATQVAAAEAARKEQELIATTVRPAEAARKAAIIEAEGKAKAIEIEADAEKKKLTAEGEGKAAAKKAELLAEADGIRAKTVAEADGIRAKLLAEAEGIFKKAEAYKQLDNNQTAKLLQVLEALQQLVPNSIREFAKVVGEAAKPMGEIDKIIVMDSGNGGNGHGEGAENALTRFANTTPQLVFKMLQQMTGLGFDLSGLASKAGIKTEDLNGHDAAKDKVAA